MRFFIRLITKTCNLKPNQGFSLIEVIVSATLMAVALSIIAMVFLTSFVAQRKVVAFEQVNSNTRILLDTLSREIRTSQICGNTAHALSDGTCRNPNNNTPINEFDFRLDIIRGFDDKHISYCIFENPVGAGIFASLARMENDKNFSLNPCDKTDPEVKILHSEEVAVIAATDVDLVTGAIHRRFSGFITEGVGQEPSGDGKWCDFERDYESSGSGLSGLVYDFCQPRVTIILYVQSLVQRDAREKVEAQAQTMVTQRLIDVP